MPGARWGIWTHSFFEKLSIPKKKRSPSRVDLGEKMANCPQCTMVLSALKLCNEAFKHLDDGELIARAEKLSYDVLNTPIAERNGKSEEWHNEAVRKYQAKQLYHGLCACCPVEGVVRVFVQKGAVMERERMPFCWLHFVKRRIRGLAYRKKNPRKMVKK